MFKLFIRYVSQNMLGMLGMSCYILADTYFIARAVGPDGITALNLVLPLYNLIFAIGAMIGVGSAIRFVVEKNSASNAKKDAPKSYFFHALCWSSMLSIVFILIGLLVPDKLIALLGGDADIIAVGTSYTRIFMVFAPFFMWNLICNAFVRNDGNPSVAMLATLCSSIFNIIFDYILMFPLGLSMVGAALATACSPIVGILICCIHFKSRKSTIAFCPVLPSIRRLIHCCQVGVSAFVGEISSGVITVVFNMIILSLSGNIGVAAYGIIANSSLVAVSLFNGIAQGAQPLISSYYGKGESRHVRNVTKMGILSSLGLAILLLAGIFLFAPEIVSVFNGTGDTALASYAENGLHLYFIGFLFAGINIVGTAVLSAVESVKCAFAASISRGFVAIIFFAFLLPALFGMNGVWLAFPAAEAVTLLITLFGLKKNAGCA